MKLISISGLDGSGKTTQINELKKYFEDNNKKYQYFHGVEYSLANKIASHGKKDSEEKKSVAKASKFKIFLRKMFLLIDILRFRNLYLIQNSRNELDYIIFDRYFFDQIINILYLTGKKPPFTSLPLWLKTAQKYLIQPEIRIYFQISPDKILKREREVDQGKDYLIEKEKLYNYFCERWHIDSINANQDKDKVFEEIKTLVEEKN